MTASSIRWRASLALCAIGLGSSGAAAQSSLDQDFAEGFALPHFDPAPAGDRFFSVADAGSFTDQRLRLMALGAWAYSSSLTRTDNQTGETREIVSNQLYVHADAAYPILDWLHAHADLPLAAIQNGQGPAAPESPRLGDLRLGVRANVLSPAFEAIQFGPAVDVWVPTGSEDELTGDGAVRANPRLAMSGRAGPFVYATNLGYLVRKEVDTGSLEIGDAVTFGGAAGFVLFDDILQIGGEIYGNTLTSKDNDLAETTWLSALFGARARVGDAVFGAGMGPGLTEAPGVAPRVVFSVALAPATHVEARLEVGDEASDADGDGVTDAEDACPDAPGQTSPDAARHGCPSDDVQPAVMDSDGDEINDSKDACPEKWGDPADDPEKHGCPAEVLPDADADGIADARDACPEQRGEPAEDPETNGCPPPEPRVAQVAEDRDGDGVLDDEDACPDEAGAPAEDPDVRGCPAPSMVVKTDGADRDTGKPAVTFAGFHVFDDGSSRIFVKLTDEVPVQRKRAKKRVDYILKGARIVVRNNKNPLLTEHFSASVVSARLASEGDDVVLTLVLREGVTPSHELTEHGDGSVTLHVDLPPPPRQ